MSSTFRPRHNLQSSPRSLKQGQTPNCDVIVWGDEFSGGVRGIGTAIRAFENVNTLRSTTGAFAALLDNNTVETRGYYNNGGVPEGVAVAALRSGKVRDVFSNDFTF